MTTPACPLCAADPSMIERLNKGAFYCDSCGRVFTLDKGGLVIKQEPTNHVKRKTDINGAVIDGE